MGQIARRGAAALALLLAGPAQAAWLEARTDHFIVISDDKPDAIRRQAARLERFDKGIRKLHGLADQPSDRANPLTVYVVSNASAVQKLCGGANGQKKLCANVYGFYQGRAGGSVAFMPRRAGTGGKFDLGPETVLFHEYSHHIMMANYNVAYPAWYVEGFAEFNSTASFDKDGTVGFGKPALHRAYGLILNAGILSLTDLLTGDNQALSGDRREALYGRGWLLTHYLTFEKSRKGQLTSYLEAVAKGKPSLDAAKAAFGDLKALDRELGAYLGRRMTYYALPVPEIPDSAIALRPLTPGEAATMPVRLRSDRGVDDAAAAAVVVEARRLAAPFPDDPGAQVTLAEAEYDVGDDDRAEAAADRALKADQKQREAMIYKGRARLRRAERAKASDPAVWREARSWLVKANRAEPDDAGPLYLYYQSFLSEGSKPTPAAVKGLERAFELAPQDGGLRFTLARQCLIDGRLAEARVVLAPLAFDPHAGAGNPAATLVALIDKGDKSAIATALRSIPSDPDEAAGGGR